MRAVARPEFCRRAGGALIGVLLVSTTTSWSAQPAEPLTRTGVDVPAAGSGFQETPPRAQRHATPALYTHGDPTAEEQLMLELINRARAEPAAEAARLGLDLNQGLPPGTLSPEPKPPLAFHPLLIASARAHSDWMLSRDVFSHEGENGSSPGDRMSAAGYVFSGAWAWGENIAWKGTTGPASPVQFTVDSHEGLFHSPGHRENLLNPDFDEIGIGVRTGVFTVTEGLTVQDYHAVMITQNFARSAATPAPLVVGVVYRDGNGDGFYSVGEGLAGVTVQPATGTYYAVTSTSGGFAFPAPATGGTLDVTISGPDVPAPWTKTITLAPTNVKLDFEVGGHMPLGFAPGSAGPDTSRRFRFDLVGPAGARVRVEYSADLTVWQTLGTYTLTSGRVTVTDPQALQTRRHYRAVLVP